MAEESAHVGLENWAEGIPMTADQFKAVCLLGLDSPDMHEARPCGDPNALCRTCPKCVEEGSLL